MTAYYGIDRKIDTIHRHLDRSLWKDDKFYFLGRAFLNDKGEEVIPQVMTGSGEYEDVLMNDSLAGLAFAIPENTAESETSGARWETTLNVYFLVNLEKLYNEKDYREVERAHMDAVKALRSVMNVSELMSGKDSVSDFRIKSYKADMQPFHAFKVSGTISYTYTNC